MDDAARPGDVAGGGLTRFKDESGSFFWNFPEVIMFEAI